MKEPLLGTWEALSLEVRDADGGVRQPLGPEPRGQLLYTADGRMAVQILGGERPLFASGDLRAAGDPEIRAAFTRYIAYFGRYEVDPEACRVVHHIEGSLFPNWTGQTQERHYRLTADRLELSAPPALLDGRLVVAVVCWRRGAGLDPSRAAG